MRLASSFSPQSGPIMLSSVLGSFQAECGEWLNIAWPVEVDGSPMELPQL